MIVLLCLLVLGTETNAAAVTETEDPVSRPAQRATLMALPMSFEANEGQFAGDVRFRANGIGYSVVLGGSGATVILSDVNLDLTKHERRARSRRQTEVRKGAAEIAPAVLHLRLLGGNQQAVVTGESRLPGVVSYFVGNDPDSWKTGIQCFEKVRYAEVYSGIDLVYYGNQRQLEYDFLVAVGADPSQISFSFEGAEAISLDDDGSLVAQIGSRSVRWRKPISYQLASGVRRTVKSEYLLKPDGQIGFQLGDYERSLPLVIDPLLDYSTYLGGSDDDSCQAMTVDQNGNVYMVGSTFSSNFPRTNAYQSNVGNIGVNNVAFVTKLNANGSALVFSTYLGGSDTDFANAVAVDGSGNVYVVGLTTSLNFPTKNAYQSSKGNLDDAFLTKLSSSGTSLMYSTYFGDSGGPSGYYEEAFGVAVNDSGGAYVVGGTDSGSAFNAKASFQNGYGNGYQDAFVARFNTTQNGNNSLVWASWLGGSYSEAGYGIALDSSGNVYVTGTMQQYYGDDGAPLPPDFPVRNAVQATYGGGENDAFVTKINNSSNPSVIYSTYLGGSDLDAGYGITVDAANNVYIAGETSSTDFPTVNAQQPANADGGLWSDAFLTRINSAGNAITYSTYFGGTRPDGARGVVVDSVGHIYIAGYTESFDLPVSSGAPQTQLGGSLRDTDLFVAKFNPGVPGSSALAFCSYYGGSAREASSGRLDDWTFFPTAANVGIGLAVDQNSNMYIASDTLSADLPPSGGGVYQLNAAGGSDAFVAKIAASPDVAVGIAQSSDVITVGSNVVYTIYANNNGMGSFSNVMVTNLIPSKLQYVGGANNGGSISHNAGTLVCNFNTLTNNAVRVATFTNVALEPGFITNRAFLTSSTADLNTNNNSSAVVTRIRGIADLGLSITSTPNPVFASSNLNFTITLTNAGPWPATPNTSLLSPQIKVTFPIPAGVQYVSAFSSQGPCAFTGSSVICFVLGAINSGGSVTINLTLKPMESGTLMTSASVSDYYELDPLGANNSASVNTTVNALSELGIGIAANPNPVFATSNLTYTVSVTNHGPSSAGSVMVTNPLPAGASFVTANVPGGSWTTNAGVVMCSLGTVAAEAIRTLTIVVKPGTVGTITNTVSLGSTNVDPILANNVATAVTTVSPLADLAISMLAQSGSTVVTSNLNYSILITNRGPTLANGVIFTDPLPPNSGFVMASSSQGTCTVSGGAVNCSIGTLASGGSVSINVLLRPLIEGPFTNTVSVSAGMTDPMPGNNSATVTALVTDHPDGPILRIASVGTNAVLYWTTNSIGYLLHRVTGSVTNTAWTAVTNTPVIHGTQFFVTNAMGVVPAFYQLQGTLFRLSAMPQGSNIAVSWPTNLFGYQLQAAGNLNPPISWQNVANPPSIASGKYVVLDGVTNARRFYRLRKSN